MYFPEAAQSPPQENWLSSTNLKEEHHEFQNSLWDPEMQPKNKDVKEKGIRIDIFPSMTEYLKIQILKPTKQHDVFTLF